MAKGFPTRNRADRIRVGRTREKFPKAEFRHLLRLVIETDPALLSTTFHPTSRDGVRGVRRFIHNSLAQVNKSHAPEAQWEQWWKNEAA